MHNVYPSESKNSIVHRTRFNCNDVFEVGMQDLIRKVEDHGSMNYPKIPNSILVKLIAGVKESPRVSTAVKNLL